ncbi:MAG: LuxR C-terminal-related transcriptional regulator [Christensenellaceae bacterium]
MLRTYPHAHSWVISRPRVNKILEAGLEYPLITVIAGPGYGKTAAVADFCRGATRRLVWVHLLPIDNDPDRFWDRFLSALERELPLLADSLSKTSFSNLPRAYDMLLQMLSNELATNGSALFVFDNAENIKNPTIREFIDILIQAELETLCVIYISKQRADIRLHIGEGRHFRVGASDLLFNEEETAQLFDRYEHHLSTADQKRLQQHTGGWPMALHLIASQPDRVARHDFGETPYMQVISELFERDYFAGYNSSMQQLLVGLSCFDSIPLGLLHAISMQDMDKAVSVLSQNIFITYDFSHDIFHFQRMYRAFLENKQVLLPKETIEALYSCAGNWFLQNKFFHEALDCFWKLQDYDRFVGAVLLLPKKRMSNQVTNHILERLEQLPEPYTAAHPAVDFCRGFMYFNDAKTRKARTLFLSIIERLKNQELDEAQALLLGDTYAVMADISLMQSDLAAIEYMKKAIPLLPNGTRIRSEELSVAGNNEVFFLPDQEPNRTAKMLGYMAEFVGNARLLYGNSGRGYSQLFAAEACYYSGRLRDSIEYAVRALYAAKDARQHDIASNALYLQIRTSLLQGDCVKAESLLSELVDYIEENGPIELANIRDCARGLFYLRVNDPAKVPSWLSSDTALPSDNLLDIGRDRTIRAACRYVSGDFEGAYATLLELDEFYNEKNMWGIQVSSSILKAACLQKLEDEPRAVQALRPAYDMTWQNRIINCFVEFGRLTLGLLDAVQRQSIFSFDPNWVAIIRNETMEYSKREATMLRQYTHSHKEMPAAKAPSVLTPRETEVLSYLSQGYSREDISRILGISIHGVKKHITNIYYKLGALNRVDAIYIAVANGLIEQA